VPLLIVAIAAGAAAMIAWLTRPEKSDPRSRVELEKAVAAVDRELAANLELTTMFDQTKQAVVLENGAFARFKATLEETASDAATALAALYGRIAETESAMERRGPAGSIRAEDRQLIEGWEGDAREAQRALRQTLTRGPLPRWRALSARLHERLPRR
jgi:hypothetical protein